MERGSLYQISHVECLRTTQEERVPTTLQSGDSNVSRILSRDGIVPEHDQDVMLLLMSYNYIQKIPSLTFLMQ